MATASVTNTFAQNTTAEADEVNANFTDLVNFLNTEILHLDGTNSMAGQLSLYASDPTNANHATRKQYVDRKVPTIVPITIANDLSVASGDTIGSTTITDPGYDIEVWGWSTIHFAASVSPSIWSLDMYVDGVARSQLVVPFVTIASPYGQSIGVPLRRTAHTTGTNCTVAIKVSNIYGGGTIIIGSPGTDGNFNQAEVQWRKNG